MFKKELEAFLSRFVKKSVEDVTMEIPKDDMDKIEEWLSNMEILCDYFHQFVQDAMHIGEKLDLTRSVFMADDDVTFSFNVNSGSSTIVYNIGELLIRQHPRLGNYVFARLLFDYLNKNFNISDGKKSPSSKESMFSNEQKNDYFIVNGINYEYNRILETICARNNLGDDCQMLFEELKRKMIKSVSVDKLQEQQIALTRERIQNYIK